MYCSSTLRQKAVVVMPTGTGKTFMSALDPRREGGKAFSGSLPKYSFAGTESLINCMAYNKV